MFKTGRVNKKGLPECPRRYTLSLHNELSYNHAWPGHLYWRTGGCPSRAGGGFCSP
ncbi:MAG TPA: hypothetical protein VGB98_12705 [Pyrinomonadaceae bacterium]